jgi:glycosyltransferase involved in cell wall biosynthesis
MTRIGINPARGKVSHYQPAAVTVAILTYIPHLGGYFRHKFDVLRLVFASIKANTAVEHDLLVFDNGSCKTVIDYLQALKQNGHIDYLILSSRNLGKIGAFKVLLNAAPGEIVAYADDDILFYPGWLKAALEVMETYPKVGMISCIPVRDNATRARKSLQAWIETQVEGLTILQDRDIPDNWESDWAVSTGRDPQEHLQKLKDQPDLFLNLNGIEAYGSASHFQFVAPKMVILRSLPTDWSGKLMGSMVELDEAVDAQGYLRLSTVERFVRHIGNTLSDEMVREANNLGLQVDSLIKPHWANRNWLLRIPGSGRIFRAIYDWLFSVLQGGN